MLYRVLLDKAVALVELFNKNTVWSTIPPISYKINNNLSS